MDKDNKKQRWPTLIWMHHKSVCGQQTNKDNAEQVFEMRWGGWQTWSCQFVKRSCKRHFFFTFFTSWRWCFLMLMTQVLARVTSHIFQKLYFAIFQKRVGMRTKFWKILVLAKGLMLVKNCCFQPSFRYAIKIHKKLWYPLLISKLVLQLLCPFLLLMVQILVAKMICQHCIARMVIAWWFFWTIHTFYFLLLIAAVFFFATKIVFSFDFANTLVCTTYKECHGVQNQTIIGIFFVIHH